MLAWLAYHPALETPRKIVAGSTAQADASASARGLSLGRQLGGRGWLPVQSPLDEASLYERARVTARRRRRRSGR